MLAHLSIGPVERTERINLIDPMGFCLDEAGWIPQAGDHATSWRESALADYRQPASYKDLTTIETFGLLLKHGDQDLVIYKTQDLRRILRRALDYWISRTSSDVIYLEARASCETNTRYAVVYEGRDPHDDYPYREPLDGMANLALVVERGPWLSQVPGVGEAILIQGAEDWCFPSHLTFDADSDNVNCGNDAKLNNLPDFGVSGKGPITAEAWIRATGWGEGGVNGSRIFDKTDWGFAIQPTNGLVGWVTCDGGGQQGRTTSGEDDFTVDGEWHHVVMTYNEILAGVPQARHVYLGVDGAWVSELFMQLSIGNYLGDAVDDLFIGDLLASNRCFDGDIGWVRVSNSIRYNPAGLYTVPDRCTLPDIDANTMGQWIKEGEGVGAGAVDNQAGGTAGNLTGATWDCDCPETFGYVPPAGGVPALDWWDPLDEGLCVWGAWQAKDAGSFLTSLVDLTGNGNDLGDPGGANTPGWAAGAGWTFDGINDYLTTTFVPQNDQSQAMLCQFTSWVDIAGNNYLAGSYTVAANGYFTIAPDNGNIVFGGNGQNHWYFGSSFNTGNLGVSGFGTWKNGTRLVGNILTWSVVPAWPVYVGCFNNAGAAAGFAQVQMQAYVLYDCHLTAAQMNRVWAAMSAL